MKQAITEFCTPSGFSPATLMIDRLFLASMAVWLLIVGIDWPYWKTAPYQLHTHFTYGIVFTYLFFKLDTKSVSYLPRALVSFLAGVNGI